MKTETSQFNPIEINPEIKTAIIYSIEQLFVYIVEIKQGDKSYYISADNEPLKFGNLEEARAAAVKENAEVAYLALSKVSAEADLSSRDTSSYDYSRLPLQTEK